MTEIKVVSWNIKDFGTYDYSSTMSVMVETLKDADIVVIHEVACNRVSKSMSIDVYGARTCAFDAVELLRDELDKNDSGTDWLGFISGVNAGSRRRDAYAYLWKEEPINSQYKVSVNVAKKIELEGEVSILRVDKSDAELPFPDRRPGCGSFKITDAADQIATIPIIAFHASVPVNSKTAWESVLCMAETKEVQNGSDLIICGDFNLDFDQCIANYSYLKTNYDLTCSLGDITTADSGIKTSIISKWQSGIADITSSAYDNILYKGSTLSKLNSGVIDIIANYANDHYSHLPPGSALRYAWLALYPKHAKKAVYGAHGSTSSGISDHLPVFGIFNIS